MLIIQIDQVSLQSGLNSRSWVQPDNRGKLISLQFNFSKRLSNLERQQVLCTIAKAISAEPRRIYSEFGEVCNLNNYRVLSQINDEQTFNEKELTLNKVESILNQAEFTQEIATSTEGSNIERRDLAIVVKKMFEEIHYFFIAPNYAVPIDNTE